MIDRFEFRQVNDDLAKCLKISDKGDSDFEEGAIVPKEALEQVNAQIEALGGDPAKGTRPKSGHGQHAAAGHHQGGGASSQLHLGGQLPGNHQGAHRSGPGRQGRHLVGLKENVILGHLIPAGTGFRTFQESEVRYQPEALEALAAEKERALVEPSRCSNRLARGRQWRRQRPRRPGAAASAARSTAPSTRCSAAAATSAGGSCQLPLAD